ncbi:MULTISPECIES: hypothetical protein [Bacillus]|uniref:hypothetical protein n=1 Tax=Bacillus TaxID=1386 RepID=UPI000BB6E77A|nr:MULTISPECIES: hypothetical protein [Bacillus]
MNKQRKEIIIKEITYWKKSKLLPGHYCDYLLALYSEGEDTSKSESANNKRGFMRLMIAYSVPVFVPIMFLVTYFTELSVELQMLLLIIFTLLSSIAYFMFRKEKQYIHIPVIVIAILLLYWNIMLLNYFHFTGNSYFIAIFIHASCWLLVGWKMKWHYFSVAAIISYLSLIAIMILV